MKWVFGFLVLIPGTSTLGACAGDLNDEESWREQVPIRIGIRAPNQAPGVRAASQGSPSRGDLAAADGGIVGNGDHFVQLPGSKPQKPRNEESKKTCAVVELEGCPDVPTEIFAVSCGTERCHGSQGKPPLGYTDLGFSVNDITQRLIGKRGSPQEACADYKVLDPDDPEASLLLRKFDPEPPCGRPMPFGYYQVTEHDVECIRRWSLAVLAGNTIEVACFEE